MKLVPKLTLTFIGSAAVILAVNGAYRVHREQGLFEQDRAGRQRVMGHALAGAAAAVFKADGAEGARRVVENANTRLKRAHVRWVCVAGSPADPELHDVDCGALNTLDPQTVRAAIGDDPHGEHRRYAYVPVVVDGARSGAIEVSEPFDIERDFVKRTINDSIVTALALAAMFALCSFLLGVWLVARPTRALVAKARRVGAGDFGGPLPLDRKDELGDLAAEMNAMCSRLEVAQARILAESSARIAALEQLRHADRLTTVGKLASGIAHELGTPLNVIEARASMIVTGEASGAEVKTYASIVVDASEKMTRIIRQLLAFARRKGPEKAQADLAATSRQAIELIEPYARKRGVSVNLAPAAEAVAEVDAMQIQQALANILLNAIQSMDVPGVVDVVVEATNAVPPPDVGGPEGEYLSVRVKDQGSGIAPDDVAHVFEPFFTTKDVGDGTGLGLSVAYGIALDHGGWIGVESERGKGSVFSLYVPRAIAKVRS